MAYYEEYRAHVRIRKWDGAEWGSAWDLDRLAIKKLRCLFLAYRVEDRCEVELTDPGRYAAAAIQDILDDLEQHPQALYRLDVYAFDSNLESPAFPDDWLNDMIFWSGVLQRREANAAQSDRGVKLSASGWTQHLSRIPIQKKAYFETTVRAILEDLVAEASPYWPGDLELLTRASGLDARLEVGEIGWSATTFRAALEDLAQLGQFFVGVSVSGYPVFETQSSAEFRLVFYEPHSELDEDPPAVGLGDECGIFIDASNDPRCVAHHFLIDDSGYATRWDVTGAPLHIDLVSVVTGTDRNTVRDTSAYSNTVSGQSGAFIWEDGFTGFTLVLIDQGRRILNDADTRTGDIFPAGRIDVLPLNLRTLDGDSSFVIVEFAETSGTVEYTLGNFPALEEDLSQDISETALRYILRPGSIRVLRTLTDTEAAAAREQIAAPIDEPTARGMQAAGTLAQASRWAERRNAEQVRIAMRAWQRVPNGSRNQHDNLVAISFGDERMTLLGVAAAGGDDFVYGSDERACGGARTYEIRACAMTLTEAGWDVEWTLGSAPRDLLAVVRAKPVRRKFGALAYERRDDEGDADIFGPT